MVERQYLTLIFLIFLPFTTIASPWLPKEGGYHYYTIFEGVTTHNTNLADAIWGEKKRLYLYRNDLQKQLELASKNTRVTEAYIAARQEELELRIREIDQQILELSKVNYHIPSSISAELEYGYLSRMSFGIKYHYSRVAPYKRSRSRYEEVVLSTKLGAVMGESYVCSVVPKINLNNHNTTLGVNFMFGKSHIVGHIRGTEVKLLDNIEYHIDDLNYLGRHKIINTFGVELGNRLWLLYDIQFNEGNIRKALGVRQKRRHKISIAYKLSNKPFVPTLQTSYFRDYWVVRTSRYHASVEVADGIGIGIWMNF